MRKILEKTFAGATLKFVSTNTTDRMRIKNLVGEEKYLSDFIQQLLPSDQCMNIGAAIGTSALFIAANSQKLLAVEPDPVHHAKLLDNISLNDMQDKVSAVKLGLSNYTGTATLFTDNKTDGICPSLKFHAHTSKIEIPITTLDQLCQSKSFFPDAIFMDVEGEEKNILLGAVDLLENHAPRLWGIEIHEWKEPEIMHSINSLLPNYELIFTHRRAQEVHCIWKKQG